MSSGNYVKYEPRTWFECNRNSIIKAFNNKPKVLRRNKKIEKLKKEIKALHEQDNKEWAIFRDKCRENESIDER